MACISDSNRSIQIWAGATEGPKAKARVCVQLYTLHSLTHILEDGARPHGVGGLGGLHA